MIVPPRVKRGDKIGIIAPAGKIAPARLKRGLDRLSNAFEIVLAPSVAAPPENAWSAQGFSPSYLAASDDQRVEELHAMLRDPEIRAIVLARGGYGIMRILPMLDGDLLRRDPKPIVGFSDATALLSWAYRAGVRGIHGPMIGQLADVPDDHVEHLVRTLCDPTPSGIRPWAISSHGAGTHVGELIPGNLTLVSLLVGTPWALPFDGSICLFEEVGERPYEIDRYLTQLMLTRAVSNVRAFLIGDLDKCEQEGDPPHATRSTILERLAAWPIAMGAPIGHGARNEAVPFGARCELDLDRGVVAILDGAVA